MADDRSSGEPITAALLRSWPLPRRGGSKDDRGGVLVVGGARATPGAAMLAGLAALRVGAGRLTLAVSSSTAVGVATAVPEAGVVGLPESPSGSVSGAPRDLVAQELDRADVVLIGPGLDAPDGTRAVIEQVRAHLDDQTPVVLDAFALGVLGSMTGVRRALAGRVILTPNSHEAALLLNRDDLDAADAAVAIAERYEAVVALSGTVATPTAGRGRPPAGTLAWARRAPGTSWPGAVAGLVASGTELSRATCWGVALHSGAGDRLAASVGPVGFLARELVDALPSVLLEYQVT